ncbi:hypothetical protein B0T09DRAFT_285497, partial [Sordaria sp. MPI-SDFR-AT-0083]
MVSFKVVISALAAGSIQFASAIVVPDGGVTPHDQYSSSVGVLGCKIDTNRVAYWREEVDCDNICVEVTANNRSVTLLKIDHSGGAYDISFDAWHYLAWGDPAIEGKTRSGGHLAADYKFVPNENCRHLIHTASGKPPLMTANSMNFVSQCKVPGGPRTWVGE